MKVHFQFSVAGFSNSYLIAHEKTRDAVIVDPGVMDVPLLNLIESNHYSIRGVLITHGHEAHVNGLRTLLKVYDTDVYAYDRTILGKECREVRDGDRFTVAGLEVSGIGFEGHSNDSIVYKLGRMLFTGDVLSAGLIGSTPNSFARALLIGSIKEKILTLDGDYLVFPGHGAPSTLMAEKATNPAFAS